MRGMFTAGVMDVMLENGIEFDGAIGVSAGAAFGCNYKSRQIGRVIRYNTAYCSNPEYCSIRSWFKTGDLYGADFCYHKIPEELDPFDNDTFVSNKMEFYLVCTNACTGEPIYKKIDTAIGSEIEWIRASASMPLASRVVETDGYKLIDGAIADSIPLKYFESIGYERNVVILTRPIDYIKKKPSCMPLIKLALWKYPKTAEAMAHRHEMYNETTSYISQREKTGAALVLRPDAPLPIGHVEKNPKTLRTVYEMGRDTAMARLQEIKYFLSP